MMLADHLWPQRVSEHLAEGQIEAILAHEVSHVRRRDNLAAALHMIVEALFWFHPLVWWLGTRLVDESERACDEEVLRLGSRRSTPRASSGRASCTSPRRSSARRASPAPISRKESSAS